MSSINVTCTGVPNTTLVSTYELPFTYSNMFKAESPINFAINLTYLNQLRTAVSASTISSTQINNGSKILIVFLCDSINGSNVFVNIKSTKTYSINSGNLNNNFLFQDLSLTDGTFDISNYDLGLSMSQSEILAVHKKYKLIFRISESTSPNTTPSTQNGDIVQDFYLMLQTEHHGPYEVAFECFDATDPTHFSFAELQDIQTNIPVLIGGESQRVFYPKNISELNAVPIYTINSGTEQDSLMYDFYGSLLASYGYFVMMPTDLSRPAESAQTMKYLKTYSAKMAGGKFANKLDFHKLFSSGHSLGGGRAAYLVNQICNGLPITPDIPDLSITDFKGIIQLEPAAGFNDLYGFTFAHFLTTSICSVNDNYGDPSKVRPYRTDNENYIAISPKIRIGQHDDIANSIKGTNFGVDSPNFVISSNTKVLDLNNLGQRSYNSKVFALNFLAEHVVLYFACQHDSDVLNYFYNTNNSYLPSFYQNKQKYGDTWYTVPKSKINFIENFSTTENFTTNNIINQQIIGKDFIDELYGIDLTLKIVNLPSSSYPTLYINYLPFYVNFTEIDPSVRNPVTYANKTYLFELGSSNSFLNFNKSGSPLNLSSYNYISIMAAIAEKVINHNTGDGARYWERSLPTSLHEHFGLELTDINNNVCMISTHQNNRGVYVTSGARDYNYTTGYSLASYGQFVTCRYMNFKITDFKNKNPSMDMTQIKNIKILFDSSVGTNKGYSGAICLNAISTIN